MARKLILPVFVVLLLVSAFSPERAPLPPGPVDAYLNGIFPEKSPGASGAWSLEDTWPGISIPSPLRIIPFPNTDDLLVLSKLGEVWRVSLQDQTQQLVLDIKDRSFKGGEAGTTSIALHPKFGDASAPDKQLIFVFYRYKPNPDSWDEKGFNRLSKFQWDGQSGTFDTDSEEILIQQYDRSTWHNGGGLFFHPEDGFLYLAVGDEGHKHFKTISNQRLDRGFFGGLLRIDVDNDPSRSHPIRRQPQPSEWGPPDPTWGLTYSQGYSIPNDNPWLSPEGELMEEFYAIGIRSPYSTSYDPVTNQIWLADVGEVLSEEVSIIEKGDNLQWPYREGTAISDSHEKPDDLIGNEKAPIFEYTRDIGACIIGGAIYRGNLYPNLAGKYLFADYVKGFIKALDHQPDGSTTTEEVLIGDIENLGLNLPDNPGITGFFPQADGEILVTVQSSDFTKPGKILRLTAEEVRPDPPAQLSELGVFTDLNTLAVAPGIIPYAVNSPLWSDGAVKRRWMAIPNDGAYDSPKERIGFNRGDDWRFPEGTVFIKHFELPNGENPAENIRLETRFFVLGEAGRGYGLTYKWNEDGTDATLLQRGEYEEYTQYEDGVPIGVQPWDFPSREQCLSCHTAGAGYVLGVKTHQLNGSYTYPASNTTLNQLDYLSQIGVLDEAINDPDDLPRAYAIHDESVDLPLRIRSYLDANCAPCHRPGGVPDVSIDFRFQMPLSLQNFINQPTSSSNSDPDRMIVRPGDHTASEIWVRDASLDANQMPPLARAIIDEQYVDYLAEWIDGLPEDAGTVEELLLYPNPASDWLGIRIPDRWQPPFEAKIFNAQGQFIRSVSINSHAQFLDVNNVLPGSYLLQIGNGREWGAGQFIVH
jgi:uncharacterized repeat protein (TIGR03806 family)